MCGGVSGRLAGRGRAAWVVVASKPGKRVEIDRDSIVVEGGGTTARGRIALDKPIVDTRTGASYRVIEISNRFDCAERTHATLKRAYTRRTASCCGRRKSAVPTTCRCVPAHRMTSCSASLPAGFEQRGVQRARPENPPRRRRPSKGQRCLGRAASVERVDDRQGGQEGRAAYRGQGQRGARRASPASAHAAPCVCARTLPCPQCRWSGATRAPAGGPVGPVACRVCGVRLRAASVADRPARGHRRRPRTDPVRLPYPPHSR